MRANGTLTDPSGRHRLKLNKKPPKKVVPYLILARPEGFEPSTF